MTRLGLAALVALAAACGPPERDPPHTPRVTPCPPPVDPDRLAVVVGTIGKLHLVESRYPLTRLGDILTAFKPDLVLVEVRPDPFHEGKLEDASFEMTYASFVAKQRGIPIEPIGWFREADLGVEPPPIEPWDAAEIARRETEILTQPALFTFEQANGKDILEKLLAANRAVARWRGGDPIASKRRAWVADLASSVTVRRDRPKRVLAYVDLFDRPAVDAALHGVGYATRGADEIVAAAKEVVMPDVPPPVIEEYRAQLERLRARAPSEKATAGERALWAERQRVLEVAIDKRGACCVATSALAIKP